jgi:hypothetical protein
MASLHRQDLNGNLKMCYKSFQEQKLKTTTYSQQDTKRQVRTWPTVSMHDDGFFSSRQDSVNTLQVSAIDHLEEEQPGCRINCLIRSGFVDLVIYSFLAFAFLDGKVSANGIKQELETRIFCALVWIV